MAYYRPLQRVKTDNKWYYTITDGDGVKTHPCCSEQKSCPKCLEQISYFPSASCDICNGKGYIDKENFCGGHDTAEAACEHHRQYLISIAKEHTDNDCQHKCLICDAWTQRFYSYGDVGWMTKQYFFCHAHFSKDFLDRATQKPSEQNIAPNDFKEESEDYIPQNFDEAVDYLVDLFHKENTNPTNEGWHFAGGMNLRNAWGLWHNSTSIAKWFTENGLYHGDDRSAILSEAVSAKINNKDFDVHAKIQWYQNWWLETYGEQCSIENMKNSFLKNNT